MGNVWKITNAAQDWEPEQHLAMQICIVIHVANRADLLAGIARPHQDIGDDLGMAASAEDEYLLHLNHGSHKLFGCRLARLTDPLTLENLPKGQSNDS